MVGNPLARAFKWKYLLIGGTSYINLSTSGQTLYHSTGYVYDETQTGQPYRAITGTGTPGFSDEIKPYQGFWMKDLGNYDVTGMKLAIPFMK